MSNKIRPIGKFHLYNNSIGKACLQRKLLFILFCIKESLIIILLAYLTDPRLILQCVTPAYKKSVVYFHNVTD